MEYFFLGECAACRISFCSPDKGCVIKAILHHGESDFHRLNFANLWFMDEIFSREWKTDWKNQKCYEVTYAFEKIYPHPPITFFIRFYLKKECKHLMLVNNI